MMSSMQRPASAWWSVAVLLLVAIGCGEQTIATIGSAETGGEAVGSAPGENACGGEATLRLDAEPVQPGDTCGGCDDGVVVCQGEDEVRCVGAVEPNECGGCEPLHAFVDDSCGPCDDGRWECDGDGGLECVDASETNSCGGCGELDEQPGGACGDDDQREYACIGPEEVRCVDDTDNPCGGAQPLDDTPGTSCGTCDGGVVACEGPEQTTCVDSDRGINDCGGCETLPGMVGHRCGGCDGEFVCDDEDENDLTCQGGRTNDCGGCDSLQETPGESCGSEQIWACETAESVHCSATAHNACGGNTILPGSPGESCGNCDDGGYVCAAPDRVSCRGASEPNACGGCSPLDAEPVVDSCGAENSGTYVCATPDELICLGGDDTNSCEEPNECGGCDELEELNADDARIGEPCGDGNIWQCDGANEVLCAEGNWALAHESGGRELFSVWSSEDDGVWAAGRDGDIVRKDVDGGDWEPQDDVSTELDLYAIWGDSGQLWVGGSDEDSDAAFGRFNEGQWDVLDVDFDARIRDLTGSNPEDVWAIATSGRIFRFLGGEWTEIEDSPLSDEESEIFDHTTWSIEVVNSDDVWVGVGDGWILRHTGDEWQKEEVSVTDGVFHDLWYSEAGDVMWGVGQDLIARYDGSEWERLDPPVDRGWNGVWGSGPDEVWVVVGEGADGYAAVLHIYWDGEDWAMDYEVVPQAKEFRSVHGIDEERIWAVGRREGFEGVVFEFTGGQ